MEEIKVDCYLSLEGASEEALRENINCALVAEKVKPAFSQVIPSIRSLL